MTPAQLALLTQGEAALMGEKQATPELSDVDDMAAFAATTGR